MVLVVRRRFRVSGPPRQERGPEPPRRSRLRGCDARRRRICPRTGSPFRRPSSLIPLIRLRISPLTAAGTSPSGRLRRLLEEEQAGVGGGQAPGRFENLREGSGIDRLRHPGAALSAAGEGSGFLLQAFPGDRDGAGEGLPHPAADPRLDAVVVIFVAAMKSSIVGMREKQMKMRTSRNRSFAPRRFRRRSRRILKTFRVTRKIRRTTKMTFMLISAKMTMLLENVTVPPTAARWASKSVRAATRTATIPMAHRSLRCFRGFRGRGPKGGCPTGGAVTALWRSPRAQSVSTSHREEKKKMDRSGSESPTLSSWARTRARYGFPFSTFPVTGTTTSNRVIRSSAARTSASSSSPSSRWSFRRRQGVISNGAGVPDLSHRPVEPFLVDPLDLDGGLEGDLDPGLERLDHFRGKRVLMVKRTRASPPRIVPEISEIPGPGGPARELPDGNPGSASVKKAIRTRTSTPMGIIPGRREPATVRDALQGAYFRNSQISRERSTLMRRHVASGK